MDSARSLFEATFESNLGEDQFWFCYISALIKDNQVDAVIKFLVQGKKNCAGSVSFDTLNQLLLSVDKNKAPPQSQLENI